MKTFSLDSCNYLRDFGNLWSLIYSTSFLETTNLLSFLLFSFTIVHFTHTFPFSGSKCLSESTRGAHVTKSIFSNSANCSSLCSTEGARAEHHC